MFKKNEIVSGNYKKKFEDSIKKITKSKYAVACANGTAALFLSLKLSGVRYNDEVIVPAFSFIASINAIKYNNANPVFMDVDEFHNIDENKTIEFLKIKPIEQITEPTIKKQKKEYQLLL